MARKPVITDGEARFLTYTVLGAIAFHVLMYLTGCASPPAGPPEQPPESWYQFQERRRDAYRAHVSKQAAELAADYEDFRNKRGQYAPN